MQPAMKNAHAKGVFAEELRKNAAVPSTLRSEQLGWSLWLLSLCNAFVQYTRAPTRTKVALSSASTRHRRRNLFLEYVPKESSQKKAKFVECREDACRHELALRSCCSDTYDANSLMSQGQWGAWFPLELRSDSAEDTVYDSPNHTADTSVEEPFWIDTVVAAYVGGPSEHGPFGEWHDLPLISGGCSPFNGLPLGTWMSSPLVNTLPWMVGARNFGCSLG